jgi:hypothetical protein
MILINSSNTSMTSGGTNWRSCFNRKMGAMFKPDMTPMRDEKLCISNKRYGNH